MAGAAIPDPSPASPPASAERPPARAAGRGRPLSKQTEVAILAATTDLLEVRGPAEISVDEIAARARVSKASVYRRWPSKGALAIDAFVTAFLDSQPSADTGQLRGDLLATLRAWVRAVEGTATGRTLRGLIGEVQRDPALAPAWRRRFVEPVRARHRLMADRAVERGELAGSADVDLLLDLMFGPVYHRFLQGHLPLTDGFVRGIVDAVMAAVEADAV